MRTRTSLAVAAALLALPAAAQAKGVAALRVCGADACRAVDRATVRGTNEGEFGNRAAPRPEPWYRVRARALVADGRIAEVWTAEWLPRAGVMRMTVGDGTWTAPPPRLRDALNRASRGLRARPASTLAPLAGPTVRVVEEFSPADRAEGSSGPATATVAIAGLAGLAGALALSGAALAARRRGRSRARPA
ncbi:MAG TPA: hypothetical protein VHF51_20500 [Solirubrobacteraceae bacterium]|nr:hypothetical protein [Solirubrobacteraceae bacterium]